MLRKEEGITLIALVITIIVLLILAGVTLSLVAGENGILKRATNAVDVNEKASAQEEANLLIADFATQYYEGKYVNYKAEFENIDDYIKAKLRTEKETEGGYKVKYDEETGEIEVSKNDKPISSGPIVNGKVDWTQKTEDEKVETIEEIVKKWCEKANISATDNLAGLLKNEQMVNQLMNSNTAVDFMIKNSNALMSEIMKSEMAIRQIGNSNYASSQIIKNEIWFNALQKSEYAHIFDENAIKIPVLTDATSNGIVTGSPLYSAAYQLYYPFTDGEPHTRTGANVWCPKPYNNSWIAYEFNIEKDISIYKLTFNSYADVNSYFPKKYVLQCKINDGDDNDMSNWMDCSPTYEISDLKKEGILVTDFAEKNRWYSVTNYFKSDVYGKKFRLYVYESSGNDLAVNRLQMYGREQ